MPVFVNWLRAPFNKHLFIQHVLLSPNITIILRRMMLQSFTKPSRSVSVLLKTGYTLACVIVSVPFLSIQAHALYPALIRLPQTTTVLDKNNNDSADKPSDSAADQLIRTEPNEATKPLTKVAPSPNGHSQSSYDVPPITAERRRRANSFWHSNQLVIEPNEVNPLLSSNPLPLEVDLANHNAVYRPSLFRIMQAEFMIDRGHINEGLALYKQEAFKNDAISVFERALELSLLYEPAEASLAFASAWQRENPEHLPAQFYVAHLALEALDYELASQVLSQILMKNRRADLSEVLVGVYPNSDDDKRRLLATLQPLTFYHNSSLLVLQARLMSQLGKPISALNSVSQALQTQPDNESFITLKANIIDQLESPQNVIDYISAERQRMDDSKTLYLYEIRYRIAHGQTQAAWQLLLEANTKFDDDEITLLAALISIDIEAYDTADRLLVDLAAKPTYSDRAYYYLGISKQRQEDFTSAQRFFSRVTQADLVLQAKQRQVALYLRQEKYEQAITLLQQFGQQFEVYAPDSAIMQADILRRQNKIEEARQLLANINQRFPDHPELLFARARLLDNQQDAVLKETLINRLIFLDPENPSYQMAHATLLFESNNAEDIERSLTIAQAVLDIPFDSPLFSQTSYIQALNIKAADALSYGDYQRVVDDLYMVYEVTPTLDTGILLLRAYQGLNQPENVASLFADLQSRFALGQQDISDRIQSY